MLTFWALSLFRFIFIRLPQPVRHRFGASVSLIAFAAMPGKRANIFRNLRVVLSRSTGPVSPSIERRARRLGWRSMASYGEVLADFLAYEPLIPAVRRDTSNTPGMDEVQKVLDRGRGAVFATAHIGHWDMAGAALAHRFPGKVTAVAETFANSRVDELVVAQRAAIGMDIIPMENVRLMARTLREGKILGILADRPIDGDEGVAVRFFGGETRFPAGAAVLAMLARCPILVGALHRRDDGSFEGLILPPIEPARSGNREADIAATMQAVASNLEELVRRSPHQWYMFRNMWPGALSRQPAKEHGWQHTVAVTSAVLGSLALAKAVLSGQGALAGSGIDRNAHQV